MLLGCSDSDFDQSSVLKKAVQITPSQLDLLNNDYRRIMILQKIVESNYKTLRPVAKDHKDYIYELDCFLPFLDFELVKEASEWNLPTLVGLMTNTYRSPHCVRSTGTINKGVVKYVCQKIEDKIENRFEIDLHSLAKEWTKIQESQNLDLYYQGSIEADSLVTFQNRPMRGLMIILIYSVGVKE